MLTVGGRASAENVGPSFSCSPQPVDALARLTCSDPRLSVADIRLVQAYYALRQYVGSEGQKPLKSEFLSFVVGTRQSCGLPAVQPNRDQSRDPIPANAANCVAAAYDMKRNALALRLSGAAAEEAARAPERNIALQAKLQSLGFLSKDATIDGVFGTGTRAAVMAWQHASSRPETYFLSDADAAVLLADASLPTLTDPWASLRAKPLARAEYRGTPLVIEYKNLRVSVATERSQGSAVCGNTGEGVLGISNLSNENKTACLAVIAKVTVDGKDVLTTQLAMSDDDGGVEGLYIKVAIQRLDNATALPQVVVTGYSGGAHCCTSTAVATADADGTWDFVALGQIDGDQGFSFLDLDHDGSTVLVDNGEGFNYEFASYAGSFSPTRIRKFAHGALLDVTKEPRFRGFLLDGLRTMERKAAAYPSQERNGFLAGWVAQKALVGQFEEGWRRMLASYDRQATDGLDACAVDKSVWRKGQYGDEVVCPEGEEVRRSFPEALALHLVKLGYITPKQSAELGYDPEVIEARRKEATARYAERMVSGWFVITRSENCSLAHTSPAALITADRARGLEDAVHVLESDGGRPVAVRVDEPRANGLVSMVTFYRGLARCEAEREARKLQLQNLK